MSKHENAYDDDKLSMEEYREVYGEPSPLEKAIARKEGKDLPSSSGNNKKEKKVDPDELVRQLSDLTEEEREEILNEIFGD